MYVTLYGYIYICKKQHNICIYVIHYTNTWSSNVQYTRAFLSWQSHSETRSDVPSQWHNLIEGINEHIVMYSAHVFGFLYVNEKCVYINIRIYTFDIYKKDIEIYIYKYIYFNTKTQIEITIPKHTPNILSGEILKHNKSSPAPVPWKLASFGPQQGWQRNGAHNSNHESSWTTSSIKAGYLNCDSLTIQNGTLRCNLHLLDVLYTIHLVAGVLHSQKQTLTQLRFKLHQKPTNTWCKKNWYLPDDQLVACNLWLNQLWNL